MSISPVLKAWQGLISYATHRCHGGARISVSRVKTLTITMAAPQSEQVKVDWAGSIVAILPLGSLIEVVTCNSSRAFPRLSFRPELASKPVFHEKLEI